MKYIEESLSSKTILITGGGGFIGSNLAFYFQENHPKAKVVVFDSFRNGEVFANGNPKSFGHFKNLIGFRGDIIAGDINKPKDLARLYDYKFDYIFHEAAISDTTVSDQEIMVRTNVNAFKNILNIASDMRANVVYASSGATYGNAPSPQTVGTEEPNNVYGFSKLMMDNMALNFLAQKPKISVVGLRYFNVYGKNEYHKGKTASMVLQFGLQILSGDSPKLFEGSDTILRDFVYIEDVIGANIKSMNPKKSGIYNVGTAKPRSFQDIADILQIQMGTNYKSRYIPNPHIGNYQFYTEAHIDETVKVLGYEPRFSLEEGIRDYAPHIKKIFETEIKNKIK